MLFPVLPKRHSGLLFVAGCVTWILFQVTVSCALRPDAAPKLIKNSVKFSYPLQAYDQKMEGTVVLRLYIDAKGEVQKARVWKSSGYALLDSSALEYAQIARFKPGRLHGKITGMWLTWPLVYTFDSIAEDMEKWKDKVKEAQYSATRGKLQDREAAQYQLLVYYRGMAHKMVNDRDFKLNRDIMSVVVPEVRREWEQYKDYWPMSFLLFEDFLHRYPKSTQYKTARDYLIDYIKYEISLLRYTGLPPDNREGRIQKELLQELHQYLSTHYPEAADLLEPLTPSP